MTKFIVGGPPRYSYQKRALNRMIQTKGVTALLMDPGTGKTCVVIDYAGLLALKAPTQEVRVLVVCPLVAVDTWVTQMETWASPQVNYWAEALGGTVRERASALAARGGFPYTRGPLKVPERATGLPGSEYHRKALAWGSNVEGVGPGHGPDSVPGPRIVMEVLNLDSFISRAKVGSRTMADVMLDAVERFGPDLVVVDESHKIKSASGNASRLLGRIQGKAKRRIILTGTVMPHSPLDVYGQWRFLDRAAFGEQQADGTTVPATFETFESRYAVKGGFMGKEVKGFQNLDHMQDVMALNSFVVKKEDALDLPPTTDVTLRVELGPREAKAYAEMKKSFQFTMGKGVTATTDNRLTQIMRLRQITSGHLPEDDSGVVHAIGDSKVRTISSLVHDTLVGEKRVVVFALFKREIEMLEQSLARPGTEVMVVRGETSNDERIRMRKRFGSDSPDRIVMVAQIKTMSLAVNELVTASHAIFASLSHQRDDWIQARDRLDRIGQTRPVTFWNAIAPGTVDGVILQSHRDGTDMEEAVLRHVSDQVN